MKFTTAKLLWEAATERVVGVIGDQVDGLDVEIDLTKFGAMVAAREVKTTRYRYHRTGGSLAVAVGTDYREVCAFLRELADALDSKRQEDERKAEENSDE